MKIAVCRTRNAKTVDTFALVAAGVKQHDQVNVLDAASTKALPTYDAYIMAGLPVRQRPTPG